MRGCLRKNKQNMKYALLTGTEPIYKTDSDGNIITVVDDEDGTVIQVPTGESKNVYGDVVDFQANINGKLSEVTVMAFGIDNSTNYCELITNKDCYDKPILPIDIGTVIWRASDVEYDSSNRPLGESADYVVRGIVPETLNEVKYLLKRLKVADE